MLLRNLIFAAIQRDCSILCNDDTHKQTGGEDNKLWDYFSCELALVT